jgi:hypothetical protein
VTPLEIVHSNVAIVYGDAEKAKFVRSGHPVFCFAVKPGLLSFLSSTCVPFHSICTGVSSRLNVVKALRRTNQIVSFGGRRHTLDLSQSGFIWPPRVLTFS